MTLYLEIGRPWGSLMVRMRSRVRFPTSAFTAISPAAPNNGAGIRSGGSERRRRHACSGLWWWPTRPVAASKSGISITVWRRAKAAHAQPLEAELRAPRFRGRLLLGHVVHRDAAPPS